MSGLNFTIPGKPVPLARHRYTRRGTYLPEPAATQKKRIGSIGLGAMRLGRLARLTGACELRLEFVFVGRGKQRGPHTSRPDVDNLAKLVLDGLNGIVFADDGQVARVRAAKAWTQAPAHHPDLAGWTEVSVYSLAGEWPELEQLADGAHASLATEELVPAARPSRRRRSS